MWFSKLVWPPCILITRKMTLLLMRSHQPWKISLYSAISNIVHLSRSPNWPCEIFAMFQWKSSQNKLNDFFGWIKTSTCCDVSRNRSSKTGSGRTTGCIGAALGRSSLGPSKRQKKNSTCKNLPWCLLMPSMPWILFEKGDLFPPTPFEVRPFCVLWRRLDDATMDAMDAKMCVPNLRRKRICQDLFAAPQRSRSDRYVANRWKCRVQLRWISSEEVWTFNYQWVSGVRLKETLQFIL